LRHLAARSARHVLSLDRADVLDRAARDGELFWGGAIPFYDAHKRALFGGDSWMESLSSDGRDAVGIEWIASFRISGDAKHSSPSRTDETPSLTRSAARAVDINRSRKRFTTVTGIRSPRSAMAAV